MWRQWDSVSSTVVGNISRIIALAHNEKHKVRTRVQGKPWARPQKGPAFGKTSGHLFRFDVLKFGLAYQAPCLTRHFFSKSERGDTTIIRQHCCCYGACCCDRSAVLFCCCLLPSRQLLVVAAFTWRQGGRSPRWWAKPPARSQPASGRRTVDRQTARQGEQTHEVNRMHSHFP